MLRCLDTWNVHLAKPGNKYWVIVLGWNNEVFIFWYHPPRVKCVCVCEQGGRLVCSHPGERGRQTRSIYLFVCAAIPQPTDCILNLRFRFSEWLMCRVYCFVLLLSTVISLQPRFYCKAVCWKKTVFCLFFYAFMYLFVYFWLMVENPWPDQKHPGVWATGSVVHIMPHSRYSLSVSLTWLDTWGEWVLHLTVRLFSKGARQRITFKTFLSLNFYKHSDHQTVLFFFGHQSDS